MRVKEGCDSLFLCVFLQRHKTSQLVQGRGGRKCRNGFAHGGVVLTIVVTRVREDARQQQRKPNPTCSNILFLVAALMTGGMMSATKSALVVRNQQRLACVVNETARKVHSRREVLVKSEKLMREFYFETALSIHGNIKILASENGGRGRNVQMQKTVLETGILITSQSSFVLHFIEHSS